MATATAKAVRADPASVIDFGPLLIVKGGFVWSAAGDTYATGGIVVSWDLIPGIEKASTVKPLFAEIMNKATAYGYAFDWVNSKLIIYTTPQRATEKTNSQAINATVDVVTDDPQFFAVFKKAVW